jgi:hypothetical protein
MKTHVYTSITLVLFLTGGFLGCGHSIECRERSVYNKPVILMDPIDGFCGSFSIHELLTVQQDVKGMLRLYNNLTEWFLEFKLEEDHSIELVHLHFSPTPHFPLDAHQNPDLSSFSHQVHFNHPSSIRRLKFSKNEVPLQGYISICIEYKNPQTFNRCGMGKLWVDGIRYGSSERGRYVAYSWKNCLTQTPNPSIQ